MSFIARRGLSTLVPPKVRLRHVQCDESSLLIVRIDCITIREYRSFVSRLPGLRGGLLR